MDSLNQTIKHSKDYLSAIFESSWLSMIEPSYFTHAFISHAVSKLVMMNYLKNLLIVYYVLKRWWTRGEKKRTYPI